MKINRGFTLIEIIIVVIILGILASVAVPKFLSLSSDARIANMKNLEGALKASASLVYAKSVIEGVEKERSIWLDYNGDGSGDIPVHAGYPAVWNSCNFFMAGLPHWINIKLDASCDSETNAEWYGYSDWNKFYFMPSPYTSIDEQCYITYSEATSDGTDGYDKGTTLDFITVTTVTDKC